MIIKNTNCVPSYNPPSSTFKKHYFNLMNTLPNERGRCTLRRIKKILHERDSGKVRNFKQHQIEIIQITDAQSTKLLQNAKPIPRPSVNSLQPPSESSSFFADHHKNYREAKTLMLYTE
ncbi:hypothetical protein V6Z11_D11G296700 [Gossypium hirsutum]